jgi:hypothetical protein
VLDDRLACASGSVQVEPLCDGVSLLGHAAVNEDVFQQTFEPLPCLRLKVTPVRLEPPVSLTVTLTWSLHAFVQEPVPLPVSL